MTISRGTPNPANNGAFDLAQQLLDPSSEADPKSLLVPEDIVWEWDLTDGHLEFSENIAKFGLPDPKLEPHITWWERHIHPDDRDSTLKAVRDAIDSGKKHFAVEYRFCKADGNFAYIIDHAFVTHNEEGVATRVVGAMVCTTELRWVKHELQNTKNELALSYRLNAIETMGSMIAHELNQPLTAAANFIRASRHFSQFADENEDSQLQSALKAAEENVLRAGDIIRRLRELVTKRSVIKHETPLTQLINDACMIRLDDADNRTQIDSVIDPAELTVCVDAIQIQQVIINLVRNAVEATVDVPSPKIVIRAVKIEGFAEISIRDNGAGIRDEIQGGIFAAVMTSRTAGMGIGLSICRTIIEAHGGAIWLASSVPGCTEFKFTLLLPSN